jgi:hypothetical protein
MGTMCKYYYREGLCASNSVEDSKCLGLEKCTASSQALMIDSGQSCGHDKWYGLYCDKYKRFFCSGIDQCGTFEDYMSSFASREIELKEAGIHNEMHL